MLSSSHHSLNFKFILSSQYVFCNCVLVLAIIFFRVFYYYYYSGQLAYGMYANKRCEVDVRFNQDETHKFHPIQPEQLLLVCVCMCMLVTSSNLSILRL